jgi:hypothetical protein
MVQALPNRITATFRIGVKAHLKGLNINANLVISWYIGIPPLKTKTCGEIEEIFS